MAEFDPATNSWYVENIAEPAFGMLVGPGWVGPIHSPDACSGRSCVVHNPSAHHMREWPITWRADRRLAERVCPHGVGHPDPDDMAYLSSVGNASAGVHGCDGCCRRPE